jgi:hypothetical protein
LVHCFLYLVHCEYGRQAWALLLLNNHILYIMRAITHTLIASGAIMLFAFVGIAYAEENVSPDATGVTEVTPISEPSGERPDPATRYNALQERRDAAETRREEYQENRQERQEVRTENREERQEIREERQEVRTENREERRANITARAETRAQLPLERFAAILSGAIDRATGLITRTEERIALLAAEGVDTTSATAFIATARTAVAEAQSNLAELEALGASIGNTEGATGESIRGTLTEARALMAEARGHIRDAINAVRDAIETLKNTSN